MVEPRILCSNGRLFILTSDNILTINLKHCSQTCSNDHLCKTTNAESAQANSCPIVTVQDDHLSNTTSDYFFWLSNEKKPVKNNYKTLSSEVMQKKHNNA